MNTTNVTTPMRFVLAGVAVTFALFLVLLEMVAPVSAQAANCIRDLGSERAYATRTIELPQTGTYTIWVRMRAIADADAVVMQIDGDCGTVMGDNAAMPRNEWMWVNYRNGTPSDENRVMRILNEGSHDVVLVGREAGVQVDRVLFTLTGCEPQGSGDNCVEE